MVSGDLQVFPLLPVMQMLLTSGRSGEFTVEHPRGGKLWFRDGELVHAQSGTLTGENALQLLCSVDSGTFTFEAGIASPQQTIHLRQDTVMHRMLLDTDSWTGILQKFPDWSRPLRFTRTWNDQHPVNRHQYRALSQVGQGVSLQDMLTRSELPPRELFETLGEFVQGGQIEVA